MAFTRQIPLLYFILIVNAISVVFTHRDVAPRYLVVDVPIALCLVCAFRLVSWWRRRRERPDAALARRRLLMTILLTAAIGTVFVAWALALRPYGDAYAQSHIAFFMAFTVIGCIFCLVHLRAAAFLLTAIVIPPFVWGFGSSGQPIFVAIALNMVLVMATMMLILFNTSRDFADLIDKQVLTQELSDANLRLANADPLTELPNRRAFVTTLKRKVLQSARTGRPFTLALVDLDGFKPVNDVYGHAVGDRLLIEAGRRLGATLPTGTLLARLGGDEFGAILEELHDPAELDALGERLCAALGTPFAFEGAVLHLSGSVGFAAFPEVGRDADQLFERADYALYHAKHEQRGKAVRFTGKHERAIRAVTMVEQALRHARLEVELGLVFQPIVALASGRVVGFEALVRWTSPLLGSVSPDRFIPVAERSELITTITRIILPKALAAAAGWPREVMVSFNLSARDLASAEAVAAIARIIQSGPITPGRIVLEVTETGLMRDFAAARQALVALKALGVQVALDDFGTGYSSLSHVHRLPIDKLKIDRSFITELEHDPASRNIVGSIIELCRHLKLGCIVEGAETDAQLAILEELGCSLVQGYRLGRPMPVEETAARIARGGFPALPADAGPRVLPADAGEPALPVSAGLPVAADVAVVRVPA